jgi:hypothetical protein
MRISEGYPWPKKSITAFLVEAAIHVAAADNFLLASGRDRLEQNWQPLNQRL